jgi:hypothetical protein
VQHAINNGISKKHTDIWYESIFILRLTTVLEDIFYLPISQSLTCNGFITSSDHYS